MQAYVAQTVMISLSISLTLSLALVLALSLALFLARARALSLSISLSQPLALSLSTDFEMSAQDKVVACLPTIGYMNMPGPPNDCGGTMVCNGAVILTEDRIFMFGSNSNQEASASDFITGTTFCTYICCCLPCCYGSP